MKVFSKIAAARRVSRLHASQCYVAMTADIYTGESILNQPPDLPQFRRKIGELKKKGVTIRDEKVRKLCEEGL